MKHTIFGLSIFLSAGLLLTGCSQQHDPTKPVPIKTSATEVKASGTEKAQICTTCHGIDGKHSKENVPPLGGRSYEELIVAMQRVKESYSPQPTLVHTLTDEEMHDIATYFSSFK
jgi:cytochrome c553